MSLWREKGFTKVYVKGNPTGLCFERHLYETIVSDWKSGKTFGEYSGLYGFKHAVKIAEIQIVMDCSPEAIELERLDDKSEEEKTKYES